MTTKALKERELSDAELEAVTGGEGPLAPVIAAAVIKSVDFYCSQNDVKPICPPPIQ